MEKIITEKQLEYASKLGLDLATDIERSVASRLISDRKMELDPPAVELSEYASEIGLDVQGLTNSDLKSAIFSFVSDGGRDLELCRWFAYRVSRDRFKNFGEAGFELGSDQLKSVAQGLCGDEKAIKSVRRYGERDLRFFGTFTGSDGVTREGGSRRTAAYKLAKSILAGYQVAVEEAGSVPKKRVVVTAAQSSSGNSSALNNSGVDETEGASPGVVLGVIGVLFFIGAIVYFS